MNSQHQKHIDFAIANGYRFVFFKFNPAGANLPRIFWATNDEADANKPGAHLVWDAEAKKD